MIHLRLTLTILFFSISLRAMEPQVTIIRPHQCCPDSFGKVEIVRGPKTQQEAAQWAMRAFVCAPDTFTQYLCSQEQTINFDDWKHAITIQKDLFKRMLVHAYSANASGRYSASEIVYKILQESINLNTEQVAVTKKDWYHRLLAHIPFNGIMDHGCHPLLIKNKVFFLKMIVHECIHTLAVIQPCNDNAHRRAITPVTDGEQIEKEFNNLLLTAKIG